MEEYELMKQPKYRVYMSNIDKALKNFEYSSEWADLISALGKLNKVGYHIFNKLFFFGLIDKENGLVGIKVNINSSIFFCIELTPMIVFLRIGL